MNIEPARIRRPRRRDRRGRGRRWDLIPPHLPGYRTRQQRFDDVVADTASEYLDRFPRQLEHLRVAVMEVPAADPAPWEDAAAVLGRTVPATREHPARVVLFRRPIQTRCATDADCALLVRQVLAEQIASLLNLLPEDLDPDAWE